METMIESSVRVANQPLSPRALGLIGMDEVRQIFGVSRRTLDRIAQDPNRHFPKRIKIGASLFVNEQSLRRWIDAETAFDAAA
jgi:predicted DNA-binding transcriptional regulator AlpA